MINKNQLQGALSIRTFIEKYSFYVNINKNLKNPTVLLRKMCFYVINVNSNIRLKNER